MRSRFRIKRVCVFGHFFFHIGRGIPTREDNKGHLRNVTTGFCGIVFPPPAAVFEPFGEVIWIDNKDLPGNLLAVMDTTAAYRVILSSTVFLQEEDPSQMPLSTQTYRLNGPLPLWGLILRTPRGSKSVTQKTPKVRVLPGPPT